MVSQPGPVTRTTGGGPRLRPQTVSRALAAAGCVRAESEATSVRGYRRYSPGFEVYGARAAWEVNLADSPDEDAVYVLAQTIDFNREANSRPHVEVAAEMYEQFTQALTAAGLVVEQIVRLDRIHALRVTTTTGVGLLRAREQS